MRKTVLALSISIISGALHAANSTVERLEQAEQRIQYLEQRVQDQNQAITNQKATGGASWADSIEVSGLIEVEGSYTKPESDNSSSDIVVATAALAIVGNVNDQLSAGVELLYEEDETDLEVDVAQFTYAFKQSPWAITAGQVYVPFGQYDTGLISDPLTLELGETRESTLVLSYNQDTFSGSFYIFNGDNKEQGRDRINNWGANLAYNTETVSFGIGYINDLGDSDTLQDTISTNTVNDYTAGISAHATLNFGAITFIAEYTGALDDFDSSVLADTKPSATNLEIDYTTALGNIPATFALAHQTTDKADSVSLPENKTLIGLGLELSDNFGLAFEYSREEDYANIATDNFAVQAAVAF